MVGNSDATFVAFLSSLLASLDCKLNHGLLAIFFFFGLFFVCLNEVEAILRMCSENLLLGSLTE